MLTDMNIKRVEQEFVRRAKIAALERGLTLRDFVILVVEEAVNGSGKVERVIRSSRVQGVRGGVRGDRKAKRVGAVLGSHNDASGGAGAVGRGAQPDTSGEGAGEVSVMDRPFKGPAHSKGCGCAACRMEMKPSDALKAMRESRALSRLFSGLRSKGIANTD